MPDTPIEPATRRLLLLLALIAGAIGGLLLAFSLSLLAASRQFEHALIAQRQAELVVGVALDADNLSARTLHEGLDAYRALIEQETRFLTEDELPHQVEEMRRARELSAMVGMPAQRSQVVAMVRRIARDEQQEVSMARSDLHHAQRNTIALGILLALSALGTTVIGALQLRRSNRDLAGEVLARTAELRAIDQSRRLFFAKASHELRTPVTAIRVLAEVALEHEPAAAPTLRDIVAQTQFLGHRIEEMLALSSAAEGRPSLSFADCDLGHALDAAIAQAAPYARSIGVRIARNAPTPALVAHADRRWLTQAILAILDNGLKFSDPGGELDVALTVSGQEARIAISDSGPGILPRDLPRIFDAYYQAEAGQARGGTGLGLALARWVLEEHGGSVHGENREGGGCRIVIGLPLMAGASHDRAG